MSGEKLTSSSKMLTKKLRQEKILQIYKEINKDELELPKLRSMCISTGGLITNELRRLCWPQLMCVSRTKTSKPHIDKNESSNKYYEQVVMDVKRSLKRFPPGMSNVQREKLQVQMTAIIMHILAQNSDLHYYQGFHDICVTFLLVVGESLTLLIIEKLVSSHLRDFMDLTMEKTNEMLNCLYPIIGVRCPQLRSYMERAEVGTIFCLPWLITWFGHTLGDFQKVVRLYDVFLAMHPLFPVYVGAAIVLHRRDEILKTSCDMPSIHSLLSHIPRDLPLDAVIAEAEHLCEVLPPEEVVKEAKLQKSLSMSGYNRLISPPSRGRRLLTSLTTRMRPSRQYELTDELRRRHDWYCTTLVVLGTSLLVVCVAVFFDWTHWLTQSSWTAAIPLAGPSAWHSYFDPSTQE